MDIDLYLEKDELLYFDRNVGMKVDKSIFDDYVPHTYIVVQLVETEEILECVITNEDSEGIYMEILTD